MHRPLASAFQFVQAWNTWARSAMLSLLACEVCVVALYTLCCQIVVLETAEAAMLRDGFEAQNL